MVLAVAAKFEHGKPPPKPGAAVFSLPRGLLMGKRGRPAKKGVRRYADGQIARQEQIPEGLARRRLEVLELSGAERDMAASTPLGVCLRRQLILQVEHRAGDEYERLHNRQVERAKHPHGCLAQTQPSGAGIIASLEQECTGKRSCRCPACDETKYNRVREALRAAGSRAFRAVNNLAIYHHWPRFLDTRRNRARSAWLADERDVAALRRGLQAIVAELGLQGDVEDRVAELADSVASMVARRIARESRGV